MRCLPFSRSANSKHQRFSWSFFSSSSQRKSTSISAPSSSSLPSSLSFAASSAPLSAPAASSAPLSAPVEAVTDPCPSQPIRSESFSISQKTNPELRVFTFAELYEATRNFASSNLLGEGGFGCVYSGILKPLTPNVAEPSKEVAVKLLNRHGQQGHKEWLAEVRFLGLVEHPNLVKLVGYCAEDNERGMQRLLVYEYMARGSLEGYLFDKGKSVLSWPQRLHIMFGAAQGLSYLHEEINGIQIIFRDFKTSNVLLDENFVPKLSDFGLARQGPEMGASHVSTSVVGTIGYAAPEYVQTGHLTAKSDVWSFGVVLFEMLSGLRSVDWNRPKREQHLLEWVRPYLSHRNKKVEAIMDPRLEGDYSLKQVQDVVELAIQCSNRFPKSRPSMRVVVKRLRGILQQPVSQVSVSTTNAEAKPERRPTSRLP